MSSPVNTILPEYSAHYIPEGTKIELPYNERGKLSKEIDELTEDEFNMLKEEVNIIAYASLGIEQDYEAFMESPTFSLEALEMNTKHVALVTSMAAEFGGMESRRTVKINPDTGRIIGYKELSSAVVAHSEADFKEGDRLLPLSTKDLRLAELGAMLHDVQKNRIFTSEEERLLWHHIWSAEEASNILGVAGLKEEDVKQVSNMIIEHQAMPFVASALTLAVEDPGHKWAKAKIAVPSENDYASGNLTEYQKKLFETWRAGKYEKPTSKAAAVLYCADLLSPSEIFDANFLQKFKDSGSANLKEYLDDLGAEFEVKAVAAGSFDRYVLANLRWSKPLTDSFQSAYMSLRNNVLELASEVKNVEEQESNLEIEKYNARMESAWTMAVIAQSYGQRALSRMGEVNDNLSIALQDEKTREMDLPVEEQILTRYDDLYYSINGLGARNMSPEEKTEKLEEINKLKPAYITKSMYLLYSSALPVFAED